MSDKIHWKTKLHNRVASYGSNWTGPVYDYGEPTKSNNNRWLCVVRINGTEMGRADGTSRVAASEAAAQRAYECLSREGHPETY
ncbi:hypothetical protein EV121DRAFT_289958 [Schizophyllum commune]